MNWPQARIGRHSKISADYESHTIGTVLIAMRVRAVGERSRGKDEDG